MIEVERKFIIEEGLAVLEDAPFRDIRQGYLAVAAAEEVRIRDASGACTLTVKSGSGLIRSEYEVPLTAEQFEALWPATVRRRLEKRRYRLPSGEFTIELDVYAGSLTGLTVAEVEFPSAPLAATFVLPAWFGREVTGVPAYTNAMLASAETIPDPHFAL